MEGCGCIDLSGFKLIRSFQWRGLRSLDDIEAVRVCFKANSQHLQELELGFVSWTKEDGFWSTDHRRWTSQDILGLKAGLQQALFPSLIKLVLSGLSFNSTLVKMACALNFSGLRTLTLRNCPGTHAMLEDTAKSSQAIRLTSLELALDVNVGGQEDVVVVSQFLGSFTGLENLFILINEPNSDDGVEEFWDSVRCHASTLHRLMVHERGVNLDQDSDGFEDPCDNDIRWGASASHLFQESKIDSIGICYIPSRLVRSFFRFSTYS